MAACAATGLLQKACGNFDLIAEELKQLEETTKQNRSKYNAEYYQPPLEEDPAWSEYLRTKARQWYDSHPEQAAAARNAYSKESVESQRYYCETCKVACHNSKDLRIYNQTAKHKRWIINAVAGTRNSDP